MLFVNDCAIRIWVKKCQIGEILKVTSGRSASYVACIYRLSIRIFDPEGKITLAEIADGNNNHRSDHLRKNRVQVNKLHQEIQQKIVDYEVEKQG